MNFGIQTIAHNVQYIYRPPQFRPFLSEQSSVYGVGELQPQAPKIGNIVAGVFTPVLAKQTKSFNLIDTLSVGVDRIQRNFEPLQRQVELWRKTQITDDTARLIFYSAFVDGKLEGATEPLSEVQRLYFQPEYEEFSARNMWSLSNAFTSAFKKLDPLPKFKATAKLGEFLSQLPA